MTKGLAAKAREKSGGIYVHIPYCISKCRYCDFISYTGIEDTMGAYVDALIKEIELVGLRQPFTAQSVYLGGGTPSILPVGSIKKILDSIRSSFVLTHDAEITIEANPKTVSEKKAAEYIESGISRFSLGLQSADNRVLKSAGRIHTYRDFLNTLTLLRKQGANNINVDMMLGLPAQTIQSARRTAENLVGLHVEHVSAYGLILEKGTLLYKDVKAGKVVLPDEDRAADMYEEVYAIFEKAGIKRYEVSNFSRESFRCRHNLNYWKRGEYLGFGVAAHGFVNNRRYNNEKNVSKYIDKLSRNLTGKVNEQKIALEDAEKEYIMLGLRLEDGLDTERFEEIFLTDFYSKYENMLKKLYNSGAVYFNGRFLKVHADKYKYLNKIILEFF